MNQIGNGNTSPGALLRSKREARRWSVAQVAKSMNLSRAQIAAIEADDYEALPGRTYVLGYWKNYARLLEIPFDDVIATNRENVRDPRPEMSLSNEYRDAHTEGDRSSRRAALLIGLLLVGFLAAIWYGKNVARDTERVDLSPAAGRVQEARNAGQIVREASTAFSTDEAREAPARNSGAGGANRLAETVPHPIMDQEGMTADAESLPMQPAPLQTGDASDSDGAGEPDGVARQAQAIAPEMDTAEADAAGIATAGTTGAATQATKASASEEAAQPAVETPAQAAPEAPMDLDSWTLEDNEVELAASSPSAATQPEPQSKPKPEPEPEPAAAPVTRPVPAPKPVTRPEPAPKPVAEPIVRQKLEVKKETRPAAPVASRSSGRITVTALKKTWLDVRDANNKRLVNKTVTRGTTLQLEGEPPFSFFVGTPDGVHVVYAGRSVKYRPDGSGKFARFKAGGR